MRGKGMKLRMAHTAAILVLIVLMAAAASCSQWGQSGGGQSAGNVTESRGEHGGGSEGSGEGGGEHGSEGGGGEGSGEHGGGGEGGGESGSGESGDPSSPVLALDESWDGVVNGVRTAMSYDPAAKIFSGIVENTTGQTLCFVQIELNLKQGATTVVELGPQPVGDLGPGAQSTVELRVADEPTAVGAAYDAWEIHPETFACGGPGPVTGEQHGSESGGEGGGSEGGGG